MLSTRLLACIFTALSCTFSAHASDDTPRADQFNKLLNELPPPPAALVVHGTFNEQRCSGSLSVVEHIRNESPASLALRLCQPIYAKLGVAWVDPAWQADQADALRQQIYQSNLNRARCLLGMGLGTAFAAGLSNREKPIMRLFTLSTAFIINAAHFVSFYRNIDDLMKRESEGTFFSRLETFCYKFYPFFMAQSYFQGVIISNKSHIVDSVNHYLKDVL